MDLEASLLQLLPHLGKQCFAQFVRIEELAKLQDSGGVGYGLTAQVDACKAAQAGTVIQGFFTSQIGQIEPVRNEVDTQHHAGACTLISIALMPNQQFIVDVADPIAP